MAKNIYALLVGIDEYDPASVVSIPSLQGCVNDINAVEMYLRERVARDREWNLVEPTNQPWILINQNATRQAIVDGFRQHLCNADSEDVVLFYYAGHGGQQKSPQEFWSLEPDRLDETLVCYDSRTVNSRDLADKEIAYLISEVAQKNPHVVVILDCCHSGSGTRDIAVNVRQAPIDYRDRPLSSYIFADEINIAESLSADRSLDKKITGVVLPKGRHVMLSACREYEQAKEYKAEDGKSRGAFSYFLLQTLERTNGKITYRDLARNLNALISGKLKEQSPQIDTTDPQELEKPFLGGAIRERSHYLTLTYSENEKSWVIDAGAVHGIPKVDNGGDTLVAIFPVGSAEQQWGDLGNALAQARVKQVSPQRSKVEIIEGSNNLFENASYWAIVTSLPLPPLKVYLDGQAAGMELARQALANTGSLYVQQVEKSEDADYHLLAKDNQYWIILSTSKLPVVAPIPEQSTQAGYMPYFTSKAIGRLEHIARWQNILQLQTPATSRIHSDDIQMEIIVLSGSQESDSDSEMRLEYTSNHGEWIPPRIQIVLTNNSDKTLFCNVLNLTENYSVEVPFFPEKSSVRLAPKGSEASVTVASFDDLGFVIPDEFLAQGITEYKDILKLIVSTSEFDASLLEQDGLNPPSPKRSIGGRSFLESLMQEVGDAPKGATFGDRNAVRVQTRVDNDDWLTQEVAVTIVRPQNPESLPSDRPMQLQNGLVEVLPHANLQAEVNLTTVPQTSRDLGNVTLPPLLQELANTEPFQFTTSRASDPGLSGLELSNVVDHTVVTKAAPLKLLVDREIADNEYLLPISYDGEFFLPLGTGKKNLDGKTEITIERLPTPTKSHRCLQGSIRIFFQKIICRKLGRKFAYPILTAATVDENEQVIYDKNTESIREKVTQAQRIILYIHGIIGDTEAQLPSIGKVIVTADGQQSLIKDYYDLVLAFDYENLNTTIEENARLLKQKLQAVGLDANHGKQLHIVAHSMGGLVSRWFIEREGGNEIVQHLVMFGTPNAGSPWPAVQDFIFTILVFGLNQLSAIVWPAKVVADLLEYLENNNHSLEQMHPDSDLLKQLAENPDPGVPYTIVAGDRSLVRAATEMQLDKQSSPLQRLMSRLFGQSVNQVVNLVFFEQPNDIAVTLASIKCVSFSRSPQPQILTPNATCDHLTYFNHPAGLEALAKALSQSPSPRISSQPQTQFPAMRHSRINYEDITMIIPPGTRHNPTPDTTPNPSPVKNQPTENQNRSTGNGPVIWVIALVLVALAGLILWNRTQEKKPENQQRSFAETRFIASVR
ncbi:MAG: caspase family protein [Pelatocladus maniniholoensis HA4357-MV3]|jgi:pimeloyl-ACP methyl ester carboxylesterase|uniref:Caspase family protein n=1 Tax=Pelatocladus maniniholoensis HA4357-MV3 TaxID=1117104 RepID=A0A9E3H3Y5_9NOST|nr:caspase family protein [Pelatocladus maniniholoensis HA4357-MV3]BAZ69446.1 peptidase C14 caspase catalytic subunit p20 [Fischerella sp. NIES-4106]